VLLVAACTGDDEPSASPETVVTTPTTTTTTPVTTTTVDPEEHPWAVPDAPPLRGTLLTGEPFTITTSLDGLCLVIGPDDYGCDSAGPVVGAEEPLAQPRFALAVDLGDLAESDGSVLAHAFLAEGAVDVVGMARDGRVLVRGAVVNESLWALPLEPGRTPPVIVYLGADGEVVERFESIG
jgi:hypothetical protein